MTKLYRITVVFLLASCAGSLEQLIGHEGHAQLMAAVGGVVMAAMYIVALNANNSAPGPKDD